MGEHGYHRFSQMMEPNGPTKTHILSLPEGDKGVNGILLHEDKLYFATNHGLWVKDGDKITQYSTQNVNLPSDIITCLEKGVNGEIWIGTNKREWSSMMVLIGEKFLLVEALLSTFIVWPKMVMAMVG